MRKLQNCEKLTELGMTDEEIKPLLKTKSSRNVKYWIERGYTEPESIIKARSKMPGTLEYFMFFKGIKNEKLAKKMADDFNAAKAKTLVNFIKKYGETEGNKRWEIYRNKQSKKNTFEHKKEKFGWDMKIFNDFNKSRAVTLHNIIKKWGNDEGNRKWKDYCDRQQYTKSKKYFIDRYGNDVGNSEWDRINKLKSHSYEGYLMRCDGNVEKATRELNTFLSTRKFFIKNYSSVANELFDTLREKLLNAKYKEFYYHNHNQEWFINIKNYKTIYLDFFLKDTGKVIEFHGDYWHCNPSIYTSDQLIKIGNEYKKVTKVWDDDRIRVDYIKKVPYVKDVLIVWQKEYTDNSDEVVDKCMKFLTE